MTYLEMLKARKVSKNSKISKDHRDPPLDPLNPSLPAYKSVKEGEGVLLNSIEHIDYSSLFIVVPENVRSVSDLYAGREGFKGFKAPPEEIVDRSAVIEEAKTLTIQFLIDSGFVDWNNLEKRHQFLKKVEKRNEERSQKNFDTSLFTTVR